MNKEIQYYGYNQILIVQKKTIFSNTLIQRFSIIDLRKAQFSLSLSLSYPHPISILLETRCQCESTCSATLIRFQIKMCLVTIFSSGEWCCWGMGRWQKDQSNQLEMSWNCLINATLYLQLELSLNCLNSAIVSLNKILTTLCLLIQV